MNVLLGAEQTTERSPGGCSRLSHGVNRRPFSIRSPWISSATTIRPCLAAIRAKAVSSPGVQTRPTGFCGVHRNVIRVSRLGRQLLEPLEVQPVRVPVAGARPVLAAERAELHAGPVVADRPKNGK